MARSAIDAAKQLLGLLKDTAVDLKTDFEEESKFQRWRILTGLTLLVDVVATFIAVLVLASSGAAYEAWLETSGPASLLMIRRSSDETHRGVELRLDDRYRATVELKGRSSGFPIGAVFTDAEGFGPSTDYRPRRLEVIVDGDRSAVPIGPKR